MMIRDCRLYAVPALLFFSSVLSVAGQSIPNPVPLINNPLVPTSLAPGSAAFTLTVNGSGFVSGSGVNWNGSALATIFASNSQLTATVPASKITTPGTAAVTVVNPPPGGGVSNTLFLIVSITRKCANVRHTAALCPFRICYQYSQC